eukprot:CAMPEP_0176354452 /NCGR_PEP_ID=MMETSP0126-20121128/12566_1 /TAXON_ID=141414 ORGANISM="Strombidinopsis acuminatum, Strain SPMC142" /NCGR_SAMPLE_ID=MMETSP0126 /ASSEMBLY_ACC=CAM_ASM_000229 /LENGTH=53 /DNA_ID=CAMNT_0017706631 /DNA_START=224 /DNA_END=385 /DNA_ORIENTATION=+
MTYDKFNYDAKRVEDCKTMTRLKESDKAILIGLRSNFKIALDEAKSENKPINY